MDDKAEILANLSSELSRGTVVLCVLNLLSEPTYGYSLMRELSARGVVTKTDTLYPLLRRLEKQGLVMSEWDKTTSKPHKYYMRDLKGTAVYEELRKQWIDMSESVNGLLS
jgi:DNA-binding PadR family transcriptional regulator